MTDQLTDSDRRPTTREDGAWLRDGRVILSGAAIGGLVLGAIGPWAKLGALGSVGGLDGSNDGWLVLVCAGLAAVGIYSYSRDRSRSRGIVLALLAAAAALAIALYDRHRIDHLGKGLLQVGWGLNLDAIAALLLAIVAVDVLFRQRERKTPRAAMPSAASTASGKVCPSCAETVLAAARVCRFCGHEFAA